MFWLIRLVLLISLLPSVAFGLACVSNATGNWSASGTWTSCGGGSPGDGDTAQILGHTVTVTGNQTIGTDGATGTMAITLTNSSGILDVQGTLTVKGSISPTQGELRFSAGSTLEWDVTNDQYLFIGGDWNGSGKTRINGTSGSRVTWQKASGGGAGDFYLDAHNGNGHPQDFEADFWDATGLADSSNNLGDMTMAGGYVDNFQLNDVVFDSCGQWYTSSFWDANATVIFDNVTFQNSVGTNNISVNAYFTMTGGTRTFRGSVFDKPVRFWDFDGVVVGGSGADDWNLFQEQFTTIISDRGSPTTWEQNFVVTDGANINTFGLKDDYWIVTDLAKTNPHGPNLPVKESVTVDGLIAEFLGSNNDGDVLLAATPASGSNILTIQNSLILPGPSNNAFGTLVTMLGNANVDLVANHNTVAVGCTVTGGDNFAGIVVGETYAGHAGMIDSIRSNIFWADLAGETCYKVTDASGSVSGLASSATLVDYNAGYNISDASAMGYNNFSGAPAFGANDIDEAPSFVDATRNIGTWDSALGGAGTAANAITELAKKNTSTHDSNYTLPELRTWVRAGFATTNSNFENAGHDSTTLGCCGFSAGGGGGSKDLLMKGVG